MSNKFNISNEVIRDAWVDAMEDSQKRIAEAEVLLMETAKDPWNAKSVLEYCNKYGCVELKEIIEDELDKRENEKGEKGE